MYVGWVVVVREAIRVTQVQHFKGRCHTAPSHQGMVRAATPCFARCWSVYLSLLALGTALLGIAAPRHRVSACAFAAAIFPLACSSAFGTLLVRRRVCAKTHTRARARLG